MNNKVDGQQRTNICNIVQLFKHNTQQEQTIRKQNGNNTETLRANKKFIQQPRENMKQSRTQ